jgi:hypothetical protein
MLSPGERDLLKEVDILRKRAAKEQTDPSSATFIINSVCVETFQSEDRKVGLLIKPQDGFIRYWQDGYNCSRATCRFDFSKKRLSAHPFVGNDRTRDDVSGLKATAGKIPLPYSLGGTYDGGYDNIKECMIPLFLKNISATRFFKDGKTEMKWNEGLIYYRREDIMGFVVLDCSAETMDWACKAMQTLHCQDMPLYLKEGANFIDISQCLKHIQIGDQTLVLNMS